MQKENLSELAQSIQDILRREKGSVLSLTNATMEQILEEVSLYHRELEFQNLELLRIRGELEVSEKHYFDLFEEAPVGYVIFAEDYRIHATNKTFRRYVGEENLSRTMFFVQFVHPRSQDEVHFHLRKLLQEKTPQRSEIQLANQETYVVLESNLFATPKETLIRSTLLDISLRKKMEEQLLHTADWLKESQTIASLGSFQFSLDTQSFLWSDELFTLFGFLPQQFEPTYEDLLQRTHPADRDLIDTVFKDSLKNKKPFYELEHRIIRPDGQTRHVRVRFSHVRDEEGTILRSRGVLQDITEEKQLSEEIRRQHELFVNLTEQIPGVIFQCHSFPNERFYVSFVDKGVQDILGYPAEILKENPELLLDQIHELDRAPVISSLRKAARSLELWSYDFRVGIKGELRYIRGTARPELLLDKSILWHGYLVDVTREREIQQELEDSKEHYRSLIENTEEAIMVIQEGVIRYANQTTKTVSGFSFEELEDRAYADLFPQEEHPLLQDAISRVLKGERLTSRLTLRLQHAKGHDKWVEWAGAPIFWEGYPAVIGLLSDVTLRKESEEKLLYQYQFEKTLSQISRDLARSDYTDRARAITQALQLLSDFFHVEQARLVQLAEDGVSIVCSYQNTTIRKSKEETAWWIHRLQTGKPVFLPYANDHTTEWFYTKTGSLLYLPMIEKNQVMGWFEMGSPNTPREWSENEITLIGIAAELFFNVLSKHRVEQKILAHNQELESLYEKLRAKVSRAREIHERSLPTNLPDSKGVSFAPYYLPAAHLGGDFFQIIQAEDQLILYLSDITGHDLEGALFSAFVKEAIDSYVTLCPKELKPQKILNHLYRQYVRENYPEDYCIAIFLAVLDLKTLCLTYASAGFQDPPFACLAGENLALVAGGLPISTVVPAEALSFEEHSLLLIPETTLLFYTDGLTEQYVKGEYYYERAKDVFFRYTHLPVDIIRLLLNEDFYQFNNLSLQGSDDVTLILMKVERKDYRIHYLELERDFSSLAPLEERLAKLLPEDQNKDLFLGGVHELIANSIEHGSTGQDSLIGMEVFVHPEYFAALINDKGPGFNWRARSQVVDLAGDSDRGRGVALTALWSTHLIWNDLGTVCALVLDRNQELF